MKLLSLPDPRVQNEGKDNSCTLRLECCILNSGRLRMRHGIELCFKQLTLFHVKVVEQVTRIAPTENFVGIKGILVKGVKGIVCSRSLMHFDITHELLQVAVKMLLDLHPKNEACFLLTRGYLVALLGPCIFPLKEHLL